MIELPPDAIAIGLGGNVGDEATILERFRHARAALAELGEVASAALYRTAPIGPAQGAFSNTAVRVRWRGATVDEIVAVVFELERMLGRDRRHEPRFGPRAIDLDVLAWGTRIVRTPDLEIPHPRLFERRFALRPLIDLFGDAVVLPGAPAALGELERRVADQWIEEIAPSW